MPRELPSMRSGQGPALKHCSAVEQPQGSCPPGACTGSLCPEDSDKGFRRIEANVRGEGRGDRAPPRVGAHSHAALLSDRA